MTASTKQITEAALKLPDRDRLRIATAIWKSFGASADSIADLDAVARSHELETGKVAPKTQAEVFKKARGNLMTSRLGSWPTSPPDAALPDR